MDELETATEKPMPPLEQVQNRLDRELETLAQSFARLGGKLNPILTPVPPSAPTNERVQGADRDSVGQSEHILFLERSISKVKTVRREIDEIYERAEL